MSYRSTLLLLLFIILSRATFIEYVDLIDPTESRYAVVAQEMLSSGNWLTPSLPMPEGVVPYLGKPPLHFWLTAVSYKLFGVEEWTARLPSLVATIGLLLFLWIFTSKLWGQEQALVACLVYITSGMSYFLAGASVTDVTLTFCITAAVVCLYLFLWKENQGLYYWLFASIFAALSFLTKGPISLVLIWAPIILFSTIRKDFKWIRTFPWFKATVIFLLLVTPWFIWSELRNSGFLKYFFWNENIARYLFRDYGDRYGSGHVHAYGASWLMLALAFCPWTFILAAILWTKGKLDILERLKNEPEFLFLFCWAMTTPIFFTFVRQLHAMYLLPAVPALSVITATCISPFAYPESNRLKTFLARYARPMFLTLAVVVLCVGLLSQFTYYWLFFGLLMAFAFLTLLKRLDFTGSQGQVVRVFSFSMSCLYGLTILSVTPYINENRSSEKTLQKIAAEHVCSTKTGVHEVGILSRNVFSHYWTANAWKNELAEPLKVSYVPIDEIKDKKDLCHFIVKARSTAEVPVEVKQNFSFVEKSGEWLVFARTELL